MREAVASSNIVSVGYDPASEILELEFHGGAVYRYDGVTAEEHAALIGADSIGSYVANVLRPAHPDVWKRVEVQS